MPGNFFIQVAPDVFFLESGHKQLVKLNLLSNVKQQFKGKICI